MGPFTKSAEEIIEEIGGPLRTIGASLPRRGAYSLSRALLPFEWCGTVFVGRPQKPFKPKGLIIWGAPMAAKVNAKIGINLQGVLAFGGIPAAWFATGENYQQILAKLEAGIQAPDWITWDLCTVGLMVEVAVFFEGRYFGPADGVEILMWGETVK